MIRVVSRAFLPASFALLTHVVRSTDCISRCPRRHPERAQEPHRQALEVRDGVEVDRWIGRPRFHSCAERVATDDLRSILPPNVGKPSERAIDPECIAREHVGELDTAKTFAEGTCSVACETDGDCPAGTCAAVDSSGMKACFHTCTTKSDCVDELDCISGICRPVPAP